MWLIVEKHFEWSNRHHNVIISIVHLPFTDAFKLHKPWTLLSLNIYLFRFVFRGQHEAGLCSVSNQSQISTQGFYLYIDGLLSTTISRGHRHADSNERRKLPPVFVRTMKRFPAV